MPSLQIRDLPDDIYEALAYRAQRERRSLAQQAIVELRKLPQVVAAEQRRATVQLLRDRLGTKTPKRRLTPRPETLVREDRDR